MALLGLPMTENIPFSVALEYLSFMAKIRNIDDIPSSEDVALESFGHDA